MRTHCFASGEFEPANKTFAEATYAAFLQNAKNVAGGFPGFAPWAGMRCPYRAWGSKPGLGHGWRRRLALRQNGIEPAKKFVRRGVRRRDRGQRPTDTEDPDTKRRCTRRRRDCSRVRWPRFPHLAPRPHPSNAGYECVDLNPGPGLL